MSSPPQPLPPGSAVYTVQAPDGTRIRVQATDEATAIRGAQEYHASTGAGSGPWDDYASDPQANVGPQLESGGTYRRADLASRRPSPAGGDVGTYRRLDLQQQAQRSVGPSQGGGLLNDLIPRHLGGDKRAPFTVGGMVARDVTGSTGGGTYEKADPASRNANPQHGPWDDYAPAASDAAQAHYGQGVDVEYSDDQAAANPAQAATAREMQARGLLDQHAAMGSRGLPFMLREGRQNPPDYWRIDLDGRLIPPDVAPKALADARAKAKAAGEQPIGGVFDPGYWGGKQITPATGDVGRASTAMAQSMSYGFGDEINAGFDAAGNALGHMVGRDPGYGPKDAYRASLMAQEDDQADFGQRHPVAKFGAEVTGAISAPGTGRALRYVADAPGVVGTVLRGAAVGGGTGALTGAGAAGPGRRLEGAASGAVIGGALGGALPIAGRGAGWVFRGAKGITTDAFRAAVARVTGDAVDPNIAATPKEMEAAARYVQGLMKAKRLSLDDLRAAAAEAGDKPITTAESLGRGGIVKLSQLARRPGTTPDAVEGAMDARALEMPTRIQADFQAATGLHPEAVAGDIEGLAAKLRAKAAPLYAAAYRRGPLSSPALTALAQRPSTKAALQNAYRIAAEEGRNPEQLGLVRVAQRVPGGGAIDEVYEVRNPTTQTWDYVKRGLDDVLEKYRNTTTGRLSLDTQGKAIVQTQQQLRKELFRLNPAYQSAVNAGGDPLRLEAAFKDGGALLLNGKTTARDFASRFAALSEADQQAWRGGIANRLYEMAQTGRLKPGLLNSTGIRAKLSAALGDDATALFLSRLEQEAKMAKAGARMSPATGSQTYELGAADGDGAAMANLARMAGKIKTDPIGLVGELAARGAAYAGTSGDTPGFRNSLGELLRQHPDLTAEQLQEWLRSGRPRAPASNLGAVAAPNPLLQSLFATPPPAPAPSN